MSKEVNPNAPIPKIENATNMRNVIGLAYDYKKKLVFFSDIQRGDIQQVNFDGTNFTVLKQSKCVYRLKRVLLLLGLGPLFKKVFQLILVKI